MRYHEPTRTYVARRTAEGMSKKDIMRCLKRYVVREVYAAVLADFTGTDDLTSIGASGCWSVAAGRSGR